MTQQASSPGRTCCRLCLAPDTECVEVFKTQAADKQPIQTKIFSCVQIQVHETDKISTNVCHACISYLNSWQSFKNRCDAAQRKQKIWMATSDGKNQTTGQSLLKNHLNGHHDSQLKPAIENAQQKFQQKQAELQQQKLKQLVAQQQQRQAKNHGTNFDTSFIKSEPASDEEDETENVEMVLDPSQFLAQYSSGDETDDEQQSMNGHHQQNGTGPPILTSLGLTSVHHPFSSYMNSDDSTNDDKASEISSNGKAQVPANCTVCNLQFSNRANARRHEKNIHGIQLTPAPTTTPSVQAKPAQTSSKKSKVQALNIDYTKPELYRHLLTPSKLAFILSNLNFLEQAQDMRCKCCNKQFPSYKFFMGHMRKKYHGLPRNVCFKCLKQFDSKGQFIGHLKRPGGSCPNLYRLVMADDSIPKNLITSDSNLRTPAKDILANRVYACAICDDTFRLKSDFREHVYRVHLEVTKNRETPNASCINCNEAFTDSAVRRRHFNNLDCIVYIVCNTCGEQFPSQAAYLEHVYQTHLSQKSQEGSEEILFEEPPEELDVTPVAISGTSRVSSVQKCQVCGKQYNNYYNVLRHMEAKHPDQVPQVYKCPDCPEEQTFSKQTYLRDHLMKVHGKMDLSPKQLVQHQIQPAGGVQKLPAYVCKAPECFAEFREKIKWLDHQAEQHESEFWCMFCDHHDENREEFERHLEMIHQNGTHQMAESDDEDKSNVKQSTDAEPAKSYKCRMCNKRIATKTGLQKHMIKEHNIGGELVKCTLCPADFANDKGLKVHLWRCHEIREADYENVLPPDLLDPYTQQQRKLKQEEEQKSILMANETGSKSLSKKVYECPFCHIVYQTGDELVDHQKSIHAMDDSDILDPEEFMQEDDGSDMMEVKPIMHVTGDDVVPETPAEENELWFQCRLCQRSFNSSKKLTIHMNSHQEGGVPDQNSGYPCKECNIIYKSKKSLWVHRHKKHPRHPDPSPCDLCPKVFFDASELTVHLQQVHHQNKPEVPAEPVGESFISEGHWLLDSSSEQMKPPADGQTNSAPKKRKRPAPSETPDGQYACDMCPKCFSNANALQVHRGWHFRSPDGRKVKDPSQMWHPDQVPPSKVRRTTPSAPVATSSPCPVCPHCNAKFASHNNLRRHIIEVHKTRDDSQQDGDQLDRVGECTKCQVTFATLPEWVEHKINDARNRKTTVSVAGQGYEWACDICLKVFTRKERLIQHMVCHLNDREMDPEIVEIHNASKLDNVEPVEPVKNGVYDESHDEEEESSSESDDEQSNEQSNEQSMDEDEVDIKQERTFSCELCRVDFKSSQELRSHVAEHFLNGGLTLPTLQKIEPESKEPSSDDESEDEQVDDQSDDELEQELDDIELEEAQVDYEEIVMVKDEYSKYSNESTGEKKAVTIKEQPKVQPLTAPKVQVHIHRCRVCNAPFLDSAKSIECMMSHQKPSASKCNDCQLFFSSHKQLQDHQTLCH